MALLLLSALFLPAIAITFNWAEFPWLESDLRFLSYTVFGIGLILCWLFYNIREFNLFFIIAATFIAVSEFFWGRGLLGFQKELMFNLLCILIPLNFLIFSYSKERGIPYQHMIKGLLPVGAQIAGIIWLVKTNQLGIANYLSIDAFLHPLQGKSIIKQPGQIMMTLSLTILSAHWLLCPNRSSGALILALISSIIALHFILNTRLATIYFLLAGFILLSTAIMNAYNKRYTRQKHMTQQN